MAALTSNLGVGSSNLSERANKIKVLAKIGKPQKSSRYRVDTKRKGEPRSGSPLAFGAWRIWCSVGSNGASAFSHPASRSYIHAISEVSGYARYTEHLVERDFHDLQSKTVPVFLGPIGAYEAGDRRLPRGPMPTAAQLIPAMVQRKRRFTCSNTIRA